MADNTIIEVRGVTKSFGATVALAGVDLEAEEGRVLGLLGPNGAGKTTLVRILTTLIRPTSGSARVAGLDTVRDAAAIRSIIGLAGQYAAVDELLTGRENLELVGRLYHLGRAERRRRAAEVLERFNLTDAADRPVKTYSGGMRRRLDLGASLVGDPPVLILDEPTSGLDPRSRADVWGFIEAMVAEGTTVLLTTQYLEEADRLAHKIVVIDLGKVIAEGTSSELKDQLGGNVLVAQVSDGVDLDKVVALFGDLGLGSPSVDRDSRRVTVPARTGTEVLIEAARRVGDAEVELDDLAISRPSLDDVFLALTGHGAGEDEQASGNGSRPAARGRRAARSRTAS